MIGNVSMLSDCYVLVTVVYQNCLIVGLTRRFKLQELKRLEVFLYLGSYPIRRNVFERLEQTFCKKYSCVSEKRVWRSSVAEKVVLC